MFEYTSVLIQLLKVPAASRRLPSALSPGDGEAARVRPAPRSGESPGAGAGAGAGVKRGSHLGAARRVCSKD